MRPGRSQKRKSTISTPSSWARRSTSAGERSCTVPPLVSARPRRLRDEGPTFTRPGLRRRVLLGLRLRQGAAAGLHDEAGHHVGIAVGVGPAILDVALLVLLDLPRDAHRGAPVGHAVG